MEYEEKQKRNLSRELEIGVDKEVFEWMEDGDWEKVDKYFNFVQSFSDRAFDAQREKQYLYGETK